MKKLFAGLLVVTLIGVGFYVFYKLGGFSDIVVTQTDLGYLELSGIYFVGTPIQAGLRDAFQSMEAIKQTHSEANLYTLYYREPSGKMDTMEVFVGLESRFASQDTLRSLTLDASEAMIAIVNAHRFVMPGPTKVKTEIQAYADLSGLPRPVFFLDKIIGADEVHVIGLQKADKPK